ncbi:MAG: winged helix-turn-helix domain-containing protein [Gaiellaceae bacterium]
MAEKLTTKAAIERVLAAADTPMKVPEIIEGAVPLTGLSGKTPGQTVYSVLYAEAKKPDGLFARVGKGTFGLARPPHP